MNKKLLYLFSLFFLIIGCSKSEKNQEPEYIFKAGAGLVTGSGDFGSLNINESKIISLKIVNVGDAPLMGPPVLGSNNFSIVYQSPGCNSIEVNKSCILRINFNSKNKPLGSNSTTLTLDSVVIVLSANVINPNANLIPEISFSEVPLNFGMFSNQQSLIKNLVITNSGSVNVNQNILVGTNFAILLDNCSNKTIIPGKNCLVKLGFSAVGKSGLISDNLSFGTFNLPLVAQVVSGQADVKFIVNNGETLDYNLGNVPSDQSRTVVVFAKNNGSVATEVSSAVLSGQGFSISYDQCSGKSLPPQRSCQIRINFKETNLSSSNVDYLASLSFANKNLQLRSSILGKLNISEILSLPRPLSGVIGTHYFGEYDFDSYSTTSWVNAVNFNYNIAKFLDLRDFSVFPPTASLCNQACSNNIKKWLAPLTDINLPSYTNNSGGVPLVFINDMSKTSGGPIKINGSNRGERVVLDLIPNSGSYYFNGGGSNFNLTGIGYFGSTGVDNDGVEFRRSLTNNQAFILSNETSNNTEILMKRPDNTVSGRFLNIDYFRLGRYSTVFLNNTNPVTSTFDNPKTFNLFFNNYRDSNKRLALEVMQRNKINAAFESDAYANFLLNPTWLNGANTPVLRYFNSSLLKPGSTIDPAYGNPEIKFKLKSRKSSCLNTTSASTNFFNSIASGVNSEIEVIRGKNGKEQITDQICGSRQLEVILENSETLNLTYEASSSTPVNALNIQVYAGFNGGSTSKAYVYIPSTSQEIPQDTFNNMYLGSGSCGHRVVNHKYGSFIGSDSCIGNRNAVGVGNHSDDISVRNYDKFKRVRIYDTAANKNNWQFSCGWNSLHVYVRLTNIVTNKSINFYHFDRNDEVTGANLGNCGVLIKSINPNYYQSNVGQDYLTCSLNDVLNNTNNCVQDGQGTNGFFEVEFVDTSTSSETLESFVGR